MLNFNLYEAGIAKSEVFKGDTFMKFIKATMSYAKRIEESNQMVVAVLESVLNRMKEAEVRPTPAFDSRARNPVSRPSRVVVPSSDAGSSNLVTPKDKGKKVVEGAAAPSVADCWPRNTPSVVRILAAEDWEKLSAPRSFTSKAASSYHTVRSYRASGVRIPLRATTATSWWRVNG